MAKKKIRHLTAFKDDSRSTDGDIDAVVVHVTNTTGAGDNVLTVPHGLKRMPVGCIIQWQDAACTMYVRQQTESSITVVFSASGVKLNLRVW